LETKDTHHYDQTVDIIFNTFTDPDFIAAKYAGVGCRNAEIVERTEHAGGVTLITKREVPANVPGLLKKFLGEWNKVVQTEQWQGEPGKARTCDLKIELMGVPVTVAGTMNLHPTDSGCANEIRINVNCSIPLVGGKLADFVASDIKKNMDAEYAFTKNYVASSA